MVNLSAVARRKQVTVNEIMMMFTVLSQQALLDLYRC